MDLSPEALSRMRETNRPFDVNFPATSSALLGSDHPPAVESIRCNGLHAVISPYSRKVGKGRFWPEATSYPDLELVGLAPIS